MNNLPYEIKSIICDYAFHCKKDFLIIDKEFNSICKKKTQNCKYIECFNTKLCKNCDKKFKIYFYDVRKFYSFI